MNQITVPKMPKVTNVKQIKRTEDLIKDILEKVPPARSSDMILYFAVCERLNRSVLTKPFGEVILALSDYKLPSFKSVERVRRKLQKEFPELRPNETIKSARKEREKMFREYSRT